jgi:hypothetical protein
MHAKNLMVVVEDPEVMTREFVDMSAVTVPGYLPWTESYWKR